MSRLTKQADPLQVRASRVEKSSHSQRGSRTLPAWYYRVRTVSFKEDREVHDYDFDEDLSEPEDDKEQERDDVEQSKKEEGCACGLDDPECDGQVDYNDNMGEDESERSYNGSDADYYYELKDKREERKQEKLRERKEKEQQREIEKTKEDEVCAADRCLDTAEKGRETIPVGPLAGQSFRLYCSDHVDYFYSDLYGTKRVDFYHLDVNERNPGDEADALYGDVYLDSNANCNFGPFRPPKRASRKAFKVKSCDDKYELSFQFIGNGYLKLRVSREMVFMKPYDASPPSPPPTAPDVFEFAGILRDWEKEKAERQERMAKARRSPSPRESWFEMNHPMGSWSL
ncbi:hypothetical protein MYCTH_2304632 [Thermothelomyces thermophilus ATCC 42464]|uniref:Uncharacterized protein n=1 Tax=Thermothelomyces thermophilus (strain ATCC 42464 / BCRC 31852 / DSM 1799) TaxID=573729 RepID=G2QBF6_THET4|nr:uncharacterized protein MYCTH_2304632 [Thermothelomyces thermophilus ATCC 42464]AEO57899.1 hypothetical protein MYCTH_2304632 [Thermothelomyces thermophilus ATCC 42464]